MARAIDQLFKGYTVKEIEEILFKQAFEATTTKKYPLRKIKPIQFKEKRSSLV